MTKHEAIARNRKVSALAAQLRNLLPGRTNAELAAVVLADNDQRLLSQVAHVAGVNTPSATTASWLADRLSRGTV